jgi:TolA-binding protein
VTNKRVGPFRLVRAAAVGAIALSLAGQAVPVWAQDPMAEVRLRKMEAEIRALQRVVFPGSDGKVFTPQITPGTASAAGVGQPATSAVTDLLTRMETLEAQLARMTGQIEQNTNRLNQLETQAAGAGALTAPAPAGETAPATAAASPTPAPQANLAAMSGGASAKPAAASGPSAERLKAVRAIVKPQTDDPGDDEYSYGFRLWDAKFYPEAQQQLALFVEKYPKHALISYGRNLLGRAYLDDGKPREAAQWFLQNYQADKTAGRAPDSLLYLALAMKDLKDTKRACIALAEFAEAYTAEAVGRLKATYDATRNGLKCS